MSEPNNYFRISSRIKLIKVFASTQKRRGNNAKNQPAAKIIIKSSSYKDFSPSLPRVNTQPSEETLEEKESKFTPSYLSTQLGVLEALLMDILAHRRVQTVKTLLELLKIEFILFVENEPTEKVIFINVQQGKEFKQHLLSSSSPSLHSCHMEKKVLTELIWGACITLNSIIDFNIYSKEGIMRIERQNGETLPMGLFGVTL